MDLCIKDWILQLSNIVHLRVQDISKQDFNKIEHGLSLKIAKTKTRAVQKKKNKMKSTKK